METLAALTSRRAQAGRVDWIGLRPERLASVQAVDRAEITSSGLVGDHGRAGKRALTLIQAEHLPVISGLAGGVPVTPADLRRNIVVSGINLTGLRHRKVRLGAAVIELTTVCAPCSRMEAALGHGGYNAMRGHGGWCATVVMPGAVAVGDVVDFLDG